MDNDKRLIEDYLPIEAIRRESTGAKGHINTLHLWWARRPLLPCRAAVYGALVPASQFIPNGAQTDEKRKSLGRANAAKFVKGLCQYPSSPHFVSEAQNHILKAHADRLTQEIHDPPRSGPTWVREFKFRGDKVTVDDIVAGHAPRPRVLDMFTGGGAIPLEALRLGCEPLALELNPVAHIIELCTLVYPQKYGQLDPESFGMTGPKNADGETTWGGLAEEVRFWSNWILGKVKTKIGDLYPLIPDTSFKGKRQPIPEDWYKGDNEIPNGYLMPVTYLWTRTVSCKNPTCGATVPLLRQTWLSRQSHRFVAAKLHTSAASRRVRFEIVEATSPKGLGFNPEEIAKGGNTVCPFCHTVCDTDYVMESGKKGRFGQQLIATVCRSNGQSELQFVSGEIGTSNFDSVIESGLAELSITKQIAPPNEEINATRPSPNARGLTAVTRYGLTSFEKLFTRRQLLFLLETTAAVLEANEILRRKIQPGERASAVSAYLGFLVSRNSQTNTTMARWRGDTAGRVEAAFGRHALTMVWDYPEICPFGGLSNDGLGNFKGVSEVIAAQSHLPSCANVHRGSATTLPYADGTVDAVITDPPYYDNIPYADISDFFYVWLKRAVGTVFPEHFATVLTPKKSEATALASRHDGDMDAASRAYEALMLKALKEANRVLKPEAPIVLVYAHKTTLGWATLIEALRVGEFSVIEAWPFDTEMGSRLAGMQSAALATSIFLIARKRGAAFPLGDYEGQVRPELEGIVRERVETLWEMGISGADLVIACVGAGLRAFTRFARVEYANGEEVPAERFLTEVETVVLDTVLGKLSASLGGNASRSRSLAGLDSATRFYVLWRYTYGDAELDAGEAIIFANGTHVELDGPLGVASGSRPLAQKKKGKYRLSDFVQRGDDDNLGLPDEETNESSTTIDVLHRLLWLLEKRPPLIAEFISNANTNLDQLRLVAQALAGPALKGGELEGVSPTAEQSTLGKLLSNWSSIIEGKTVIQDRRAGQQQLPLR